MMMEIPTGHVCVDQSLSVVQLKRVRETDGEMKPLMEKNKRLNKKNEELQQTLQRMEDKLKTLSRENAEQVCWERIWRKLLGCFSLE